MTNFDIGGIPLPLPIKFKIKDKDQFRKESIEYFKNHRKLRPVKCGYSTHYAEVLEYGCGPLNNYQPTVNGGDYSFKTIYDELYDWCGRKDGKGEGILPIKEDYIRRAFAKNLTKHFFEIGMKQHPYWRPAMQWLQDNMQRLFDEGYSLKQIAEETMRIADKCIQDQNLPFDGDLQKSAYCQEVNWNELGDVREYSDWTEDERNKDTQEHTGWGARKYD